MVLLAMKIVTEIPDGRGIITDQPIIIFEEMLLILTISDRFIAR